MCVATIGRNMVGRHLHNRKITAVDDHIGGLGLMRSMNLVVLAILQ